MKSASMLLAAVLVALPAVARQKVQGFCEEAATITTANGKSVHLRQTIPSCTVTVLRAGTSEAAIIYADHEGTPLENPFQGSRDGAWSFYADDGRYDIRLSGAGTIGTRTISDLPVFDPHGGTGPWSLRAPGNFQQASGGYSSSLEVDVNDASGLDESHIGQGNDSTNTAGVTATIAVPANGAGSGAYALAGYAQTRSATTQTVGGEFQGRCSVNGCFVWGANPFALDDPGLTSEVTLQGVEVDVLASNPTNAYRSVTGISSNLSSTKAGSFGNAYFVGLVGKKRNGVWANGLLVGDGSVGSAALSVGSEKVSAQSPSQKIAFTYRDSGNNTHVTWMYADAAGNLASTAPVVAPGLQLSGGARPSCTAANRGQFWYEAGERDKKDPVAVCAKDGTNSYDWRALF